MARGGTRPGAGRPTGAKSKRTKALAAARVEKAQVLEKATGAKFKGDAWELVVTIYKDNKLDMQLRLDAAKAAIRFERPALSTVEMTGRMELSHEDRLKKLK